MQEADARLADETRDSPGPGWGVEWWQSPQSGCNCSVRQAGFLHSEVQRQVFSTKTRSASLGCVCVEDHCSLKGIDSGKGSGSLVTPAGCGLHGWWMGTKGPAGALCVEVAAVGNEGA